MKTICVLSVCVLYGVSFLNCTAVADSCWGGGGLSEDTSSLLLVKTCPFSAEVEGSGRAIMHFYLLKTAKN